MPGLRAGLSFSWSRPPLHRCERPHAPHAAFVAYIGDDGKRSRFVLSSRKCEKSSCFRVGIAEKFVLSSRISLANSCFRVGNQRTACGRPTVLGLDSRPIRKGVDTHRERGCAASWSIPRAHPHVVHRHGRCGVSAYATACDQAVRTPASSDRSAPSVVSSSLAGRGVMTILAGAALRPLPRPASVPSAASPSISVRP